MIAIIDYKMGNLHSVANALDFIGANFIITNNKDEIKKADKIILPGVGSFGDGMKNIRDLHLDKILQEEVVYKKKPILGICLGMQMLALYGDEGGGSAGLGFVDAEVRRFNLKSLKVPHVGWNNISFTNNNSLFYKIPNNSDFYFVHSYHLVCKNSKLVSAVCGYGIDFVASIKQDNIFATQFHPEKSQEYGMQLLMNFVDLC